MGLEGFHDEALDATNPVNAQLGMPMQPSASDATTGILAKISAMLKEGLSWGIVFFAFQAALAQGWLPFLYQPPHLRQNTAQQRQAQATASTAASASSLRPGQPTANGEVSIDGVMDEVSYQLNHTTTSLVERSEIPCL
jgi:hypothetical protein